MTEKIYMATDYKKIDTIEKIYSAKDYKAIEIFEDYRMITIYKDLGALFDHQQDFYHGAEPMIRMTDYGYDLVFKEEQEYAYVMVFTDEAKRETFEKLDLVAYERCDYSIHIVD